MTKKYAVEGLMGYPNELAQMLDEANEKNADLVAALEEIANQNADLVEALDQLQRNLSKAWPRGDRSGFEQALLDTIDQALAKVGE